jgi:hypothetical protein
MVAATDWYCCHTVTTTSASRTAYIVPTTGNIAAATSWFARSASADTKRRTIASPPMAMVMTTPATRAPINQFGAVVTAALPDGR